MIKLWALVVAAVYIIFETRISNYQVNKVWVSPARKIVTTATVRPGLIPLKSALIKREPTSIAPLGQINIKTILAKDAPFRPRLKAPKSNKLEYVIYQMKEENTGITTYVEAIVDKRNGNMVERYPHYDKTIEMAPTGLDQHL